MSTEQILEAARELFLEQGYGVTTAAIARRAGISEGSIFKRFATKEALFFAAVGVPEPAWLAGLPEQCGQGDVKEGLSRVLLAVIEHFRELVPRMSMLWSCRALAPKRDFWQDCPDSPPGRVLKELTHYLEQERQLHRIRADNPEIVARLLLGSAQNYVFSEMMGIHVTAPITASRYATELIEMLFVGLRTDQETRQTEET